LLVFPDFLQQLKMSKIPQDLLASSIEKILTLAKGGEVEGVKGKVRGFTETIELQVTLQNYDPNKDKRFSGAVRLPVAPRGTNLTVCVLGSEEHITQAKAIGIDALVSFSSFGSCLTGFVPQQCCFIFSLPFLPLLKCSPSMT
jgi:ribosomal protein L1